MIVMVNKKYNINCVESQSATHPIVQNVWREGGESTDILSVFIVNTTGLRSKSAAIKENHHSRTVSIGM